MSAVKIYCALGLNFFSNPQIAIVIAPFQASETHPLRNWQLRNGLVPPFGNWKMKKWRRFVNTIAP
jgi:hypothetical protein